VPVRLSLFASPPWPRWVTGLLAACLLATGWVVALRDIPPIHHIRWWFVALATLCVPVTLAANAAEFAVAAALGGRPVTRHEAVRVTLLGSAANALPLPGSTLVRVRALQRGGADTRRAIELTAFVGLTWLATAAAAGGLLLAISGRPDVGLALLLPGLGILLGALWRLGRRGPAATTALLSGLGAIEVLTVAADGSRLWLLSQALHLGLPFATAVTLTVAAAISSAVGIVPAGLGVREGLAAGIGALLGVPAAVAFTATGASRLAEYAVLAPLAGVVLSRQPPSAAQVGPTGAP